MTRRPRLALAWSGGKDCAAALHELRRAGTPPDVLFSTVDEESARVAHHWVDVALLRAQADAAGLPLVELALPHPCSDVEYAARMQAALDGPLHDVGTVAFGDLFLEDLRAWREARMADAGRRALFPLWGRDTGRLAVEVLDGGLRATVAAVDVAVLDPALAGRAYDRALLDALPEGVDPCGERGEFHTFVHAAPAFSRAIDVEVRGQVRRDGLACAELALRAPSPRSPGR